MVNCWFGREENMGGFLFLYFITYSTTDKEEAADQEQVCVMYTRVILSSEINVIINSVEILIIILDYYFFNFLLRHWVFKM